MKRTRDVQGRVKCRRPDSKRTIAGCGKMQRSQPSCLASVGSCRHRSVRRRGATLVLIAIAMVVLFGMVAFAVDTGFMMHVRTDLQRTADACALAAAAHLPDQSVARAMVKDVAIDNGWDYTAWGLEALESTFGYWDRDEATFTSPVPTNKPTNAIQVTLKRTQATHNPVRLFFGPVLGRSRADIKASAIALCDRWLCGPFVGIESVKIPGTADTDSFDSNDGWYVYANSHDRGSICSDGPITVGGDALIRGDARYGKGFDLTSNGGAVVTGSIGERIRPLNMPSVDASVAAWNNDNDQIPLIDQGGTMRSPLSHNGTFKLNAGETIDLPPGTYYFRDFSLEGNATFNVTGPTTIYITGNMFRGGDAIVTNTTQEPSNLKFLMTGGRANVTSGNDFYGVIYAPDTDVTINGASDLYGAVVGRTLTVIGSGAAHYDEALNLEEVALPSRTALVD